MNQRPDDDHGDSPATALADTSLQLTVDDGNAIKAALLAWLEASDLADSIMLIALTKNAQVRIDADSVLHIGSWRLGEDLVLETIVASGEAGRVGYQAELLRPNQSSPAEPHHSPDAQSGWRVRDVSSFHIHARR